MTQDQALEILKTGANVFLTGEPGSGKTHTVNRFTSWLRAHAVDPAITASTGIAATHIGGHTIHSWSGIGIKEHLSSRDLAHIRDNRRVARRVRSAHTLIIDEVSMLSASTLDAAEAACRYVRESPQPFGGLQVILVGDFFQLPPVVGRPEESSQSGFFPDEPPAVFAFESKCWNELNLTTCYLHEQHRQEDPAFLELLAAIRGGSVESRHRTLLAARSSSIAQDGVTKLFSHNENVDRLNDIELHKLSGEAHAFLMESYGAEKLVESLKKHCLSPENLVLKMGARVLFTKNDMEHRFVNGTLGEVVGFSPENSYPIIKTKTGRTITATPAEWRIEDDGRVVARVTQLPLRLAWAITIHKSQGMSLDSAHMDLRFTFEYGQGYVAISRVRTLAGLTLVGMNERALEVNPDIVAQDAQFRQASEDAEVRLEKVPLSERTRDQELFIKTCGGRMEQTPDAQSHGLTEYDQAKKYSVESIRTKYPNAYRPWSESEDADLTSRFRAGEKVKDIALALERQPGAIRARLAKLGLT